MNRRTLLKELSLAAGWGAIPRPIGNSNGLYPLPDLQGYPEATRRSPAWLQSAIFYQVYPQSFYDSDSDGTGDLIGLISKLDYIHSIGCNVIWLNPIFESPFGDAGYDVADFFRVASRFGTNQDVVNLCREAHKREMRICLDLVAGHTSVHHPWFRQSMQQGRNQYSDWYIWTPAREEVPKSFPPPGGRDSGARPEAYLSNFFSFQPALNYGFFQPDPSRSWQRSIHDPVCRAVQENLRTVMKFWLDLGVDAFRVDMASSLIRNDPDGEGIRQLWQENRKWLDANYPEAVLVSEWGDPKKSIPAGFHIDFLLHFGQPAYIDLVGPLSPPVGDRRQPDAFFERSGTGDITKFLGNYLANYTPTRALGYISLPSGNHDFPRVTWGRTEAEVRVLFAMLLTMPGVPFLYYGDEIGMRFLPNTPEREGANRSGLRSGSRTPMQWSTGENAGFSGAPAGDLYLPIDPDPRRPNVETQETSPDSMLNFTRYLLKLRRDIASLSNIASFEVVYAEAGQVPFVYQRTAANSRVVIAINPADHPCSLSIPSLVDAKPLLVQNARHDAEVLHMDAVSFGIFAVSRRESSLGT